MRQSLTFRRPLRQSAASSKENSTGDSRLSSLFAAVLVVALITTSASPLLAVAIEVQRTTLPSTFGAGGFLTIDFVSDVFVQNAVTPLVFAIPTNAGGNPCAIRFEAVRQDGFDAVCAESPTEDGPHLAMDLHYIAIEPGVHAIPATVGGSPTTITIAAGSTSTSAVQHGCASTAACGTEGSVSLSFGTTFSSAPALLLQIQSLNSESSTPPGTASTPHLTSTIVEDTNGNPIISTTGADVALERSETQQGTVSAESIGWLAVEATSACTTLDFSSFGGPASVPFEAIITGAVVDGWADGCTAGEGATFSTGCFSASPAVVATKRTRNEDDGGWLRRCTAGFSATAARFTVDEDRNSGAGNQGDTERNHVDEAASVLAFGTDFSTPVTLSSFSSERTAAGVRFRWTTATEVGNVGFHLYEVTPQRWRRLTQQMIPSHSGDSLEANRYEVEIPAAQGAVFGISSLDIRNHREDKGPFEIGESYGAAHPVEPIDWAAIRTQHQLSAQRRSQARQKARSHSPDALDVHLSRTGLYRIYYDEMAAAGLDLEGVPIRSIAVLSKGASYPRRVESPTSDGLFGPGGFVEFLGHRADSLYTRSQIYRIEVAPDAVTPIERSQGPSPLALPAQDYREQLTVEENRRYSFASPNGDPWFDRRILSFGSPSVERIQLPVEGLSSRSGHAQLQVDLWGVTDFPASPDHHVQIALNGHLLWEQTFDGLRAISAEARVPAEILREGNNELSITVPGDTGQPFDLIHLEAARLSYQRRFLARSDRLDFQARGSLFAIDGFSSPRVVAYRLPNGISQPPAFLPVESEEDRAGTFRIRFPGDPDRRQRYLVAAESALLSPDLLVLPTAREIPSAEAQLLIISHPSFLSGLDDLIRVRRSEGYSVLAIDVEDIYWRHSHGLPSPEAIRAFIAESVASRGTEFVLLVGGDTYDPKDYTGSGSLSFIPTPYVQTDDLVRFTPSDAALVDIDGDGFPDLPIGRLPVRTTEELASVLGKTLGFSASGPRATAVFAADDREPMASFSHISDRLIEGLPDPWEVSRVYLDELDAISGREILLGALERSPAVTSFIGHSGPAAWTFDGLFNADDAASLSNAEPMIVVQWGCWNTYHVVPTYDTLGHNLLLTGEHGAAAVLGAATLTSLESERLLAPLVLETMMEKGVPIGAAMQKAKSELLLSHPQRLDVLLGWTLLGDPTLVASP
ncbi:MAG: hypothetical protein K0U98_05445 [Deltaproteobacteria bacterium]|nr:hypothetical protein [Deltaproteobacteria bacterium]